ncbi:hypothetical protein P43SY_006831 [Pythium insidiosum]|uniref:Protein kinase domain-containing protein n=1 Tax=Pythium insidiosum TaxID=114742 RepID=A0AAD5Q7C8_PYTIN|nr:hypothetical protein P43SY_006831 [Pythium insidiosum]
MTTTPSRFRNLRELETTKNAQLLIADDGESGVTVLLKRMPLAGDSEHHHHANGASPSSTADADVFTGFDDPLQELAVADLLLHVGGHPSIVRCHEHFIKGDSLFLVTEFCGGGDLHQYIMQQPTQRLEIAEATVIFTQIARGVAFLHAHNIAHRDLSLENVVRDARGDCKITDFGLSVDVAALATSPQPFRCQDLVGKANYMAPEVVAGDWYDPKAADVWSLGILLFMLVTGSPLVSTTETSNPAFQAFKRVSVQSVLEQWGFGAIASSGVGALLELLLRVDPAQRPTVDTVLRHHALR